ncbi:MAG: tetratricopeptide repeat protein [Ignavibacteria bacterium]|nr:tetratricopeptide repeat protein [Ignavibacteria bacterium]
MKALRGIGLSILMLLFLTVGVTYTQNPAEESFNKGMEYAVQGKFPKAKEEFEKALKVDPFNGPAKFYLKTIKDVIEQKIKSQTAIHLFKGISYIAKGQYNQAISDFNRALEINPKYAEAYNERGVVYDDKGQYDLAISDYTKAIEINPKLAEVYNNRAFAYYAKGQHDLAISDFNRALEINPKFAIAYNNRGLAYYAKGQYDEAISNYTKAIKINPKYAAAYNNRGFLYFVKLGNNVKGCADFNKVCELGECSSYNILKQRGDCP